MVPLEAQIVVWRLAHTAHCDRWIVGEEGDLIARIYGESDRWVCGGCADIEVPSLCAEHHQIVGAAASGDVKAEGTREHHARKSATAIVRIWIHQRLVAVVAQGQVDSSGVDSPIPAYSVWVGRGFKQEKSYRMNESTVQA